MAVPAAPAEAFRKSRPATGMWVHTCDACRQRPTPLLEDAAEAGQVVGPAPDADLGLQHAALRAVDLQAPALDRCAVVAPEVCPGPLAIVLGRILGDLWAAQVIDFWEAFTCTGDGAVPGSATRQGVAQGQRDWTALMSGDVLSG